MKNGMIRDRYGNECWYKDGQLHREVGPAYISKDCQAWYREGKYHREDGPAVIDINGFKAWYFNGKRHRVDGPAIIYEGGEKVWCLNHVSYKKEAWWEMLSDEWKVKALFNGEGV